MTRNPTETEARRGRSRRDDETVAEIDRILHHATDLDQEILTVTENIWDDILTVDLERSRHGFDRVAALLHENADAHDAARKLLRDLKA